MKTKMQTVEKFVFYYVSLISEASIYQTNALNNNIIIF